MAGAQAARDGASPRRHAAAAAACARRLLAVGAAARRAAAVCTTNRRQPPAAVSQGGGSGRMCGGHAVPEVPKNLAESAWRPASPRGQRHRPAHPQPHSRPKPTEQATTHPPLLPPHRAATQTRQAALTHHALAQADAQRLITAAVAANRLGQARAGCHHGGHLHQSNAVLARRQHPSWQTPPGWGAGACRRSRARRFAAAAAGGDSGGSGGGAHLAGGLARSGHSIAPALRHKGEVGLRHGRRQGRCEALQGWG